MAVDSARARELALALPSTSEAPHFDRLAFRTPRKIFATLGAGGADLNLAYNPAFAPVPGGWGRMGATRCDLARVDEPTLVSALRAAHALAAPKPKRR
jgi:hypothetical protein